LAVIRRRYYIFFPVFCAIVGAHLLWVTYGARANYETRARIVVHEDRGTPEDSGPLSWRVWLRTPTPQAVASALQDPAVRARMTALLSGEEDFTLREFKRRPLADEIEEALQSFRKRYRGREEIASALDDLVEAEAEDKTGTVQITGRGPDEDSSRAVAWAATEAVVRHFRDLLEEDLNYFQETLQEESQRLKEELAQAEKKWSAIVSEVGFDPVAKRELIEQEIRKLEAELEELSARQQELGRRYRELVQARPLMEGNPNTIHAQKLLADNERVQALEKRIVELKLQRDEQLESRTRNHPEVRALEAKIKFLEERLPEVIREELAKSLVELNDRQISDILFESRKVALERELKQEQIAGLKKKLQELSSKVLAYLPVKKTCDDLREKYRSVLAMANNVAFLGKANFMGRVRILDPGRTPFEIPVRGRGPGAFFLTVLLGLLASLSAVYFVEYLDVRVKTEHDVTRYLNLPLIGVLPTVDRRELLQLNAEGTPVAERFNTAATLLRTTARELDLRSFAVCSAVAQEGKTTVCVNLAAALARKGSNVVLVDADLRRSQVHRLLGLSNDVGLSTILSGWISPRQVIDGIMNQAGELDQTSLVREALQDGGVPGLRVLTSGPAVETAAKLIESDRFPQLIRQLTEMADFVIFDTPPLDRVGDALTVASLVDGCIVVVGAGQCEHHDVKWAKHLLTNVQANLLGAFLNRYTFRRSREAEYYAYGYESRNGKPARVRV